MERSFLARFFWALVGVAVFALFLVDKAEDRWTHIFSWLPNRLTSMEREEAAALLSRTFATVELAQALLLFGFATTATAVALAIAAGARRQGPISLLWLGVAVPALLYVIASKAMG